MSSCVIEIPPAVEPVSLDTAKNFLRLESDFTNDDDLVSGLIVAAREAVEAFTGLSLVQKGYRQCLDSFPYFTDTVSSQMAYPPSYYSLPRYSTTLWNYSQMIKLYYPPLVSVDRITYLSSDDEEWHDLVAAPPLWYPGTLYAASPAQVVTDGNGNVQQCINPGTSQHNPPNWSTVVPVGDNPGGTTTEKYSGVVWQNMGPVKQWQGGNEFGSYIVDIDSRPGRIFPGPPGGTWPPVLYVPNAVQIHYTAGFSADNSLVPQSCQTAILQLIANWYENREAAAAGNFGAIPNHVQMLLWTKRVLDFQPTR
jgi:hypothetical protein